MADKQRPYSVSMRGMDRKFWKRVKDYCWEKGMPLRQFVIEALEDRLKK